jgi:hypothetical protein
LDDNPKGMGMIEFCIPVRNEFTGEIRLVRVLSDYHGDAQVEALHTVFRGEGWTKATALLPQDFAAAH